MADKDRTPPVSPLHGVWLSIFAIDASLAGAGWDHQLGALALGLLFAVLLVTELMSSRRSERSPFRRPEGGR